MMSTLIEQFLYRTCSDIQADGILSCFDTICLYGLDSIDYGFTQLVESTAFLDTSDITVQMHNLIESYQQRIFADLEMKVDREITPANELLLALRMLESSEDSKAITAVIDDAMGPEEALINLLSQVLFINTSTIEEILFEVPSDLIDKLYSLHYTKAIADAIEEPVVRIHPQKIKRIRSYFAKYPDTLAHQAIRTHNLSIGMSYELFLSKIKVQLEGLSPRSPEMAAIEFVGLCLAVGVDSKDVGVVAKKKITSFYPDLNFSAKTSYEVDKIATEINTYA